MKKRNGNQVKCNCICCRFKYVGLLPFFCSIVEKRKLERKISQVMREPESMETEG